MISSLSRLIHKKWPPLKDIDARDLKFSLGPCITYTHAVQKWRLNLRRFEKLISAKMLIFGQSPVMHLSIVQCSFHSLLL